MELSRAAVLMFAVVALTLCGAGEGKIKTTHKELKCSCCVSVASEMKAAVLNEWETHSGATILIEKRKKKLKVPYAESELSVQEALDHVCEERRYSKYNVTAVNGKPRYVKQEKDSSSKEFKKRLAGMCQDLMEHDQAIISHFYQNSKNVEVLERTEFEICTSVVSYCTTEQYAQVTALKQVTAPDEEEEGDTEKVNEQEGAEGNPEL